MLNRADYCAAHHYDLIVDREVLDPKVPPRVSRLIQIQKNLPKYDWIVSLDPFSIVMDFSRRFDPYLDRRYDLILSIDRQGVTADRLIVQNTDAARRFFDAAVSQQHLMRNPWQERGLLINALQHNPGIGVKYISQLGFASDAHEYRAGDLLLTFPLGVSNAVPPENALRQLLGKVRRSHPAVTNRQGWGPIVIDGVFFQMYKTGIARVWQQLLEQWSNEEFGQRLLVLDRVKTAPRARKIRYRDIQAFDYGEADADRRLLQSICDEESADVFISTYYTTPLSTPSVFMAHDMIPEIFGWDLRHPMWREKHLGIAHASAFVCVSEATRRDLLRLVPGISAEKVHVTPLAAAGLFRPRSAEEIEFVRNGTGLSKPYFLTVGARGGYKNTMLTFRALAQYPRLAEFDIFCAGHVTLEPEYQALLPQKEVKAFNLSDDELAAAYSGAVALLHPSTYEGFGLPVLEAMACGCPVITTKNGSLAEVAGEAAIFVGDDDVAGMAAALDEVQKPEVRARMIAAGFEQARKFSWQKTADGVKAVLLEVARQEKLRADKGGL